MRKPRDRGSILFLLALALLRGIAGCELKEVFTNILSIHLYVSFFFYTSAYCPGCPSCEYCYLQYPSNTSAQCNPFQVSFVLNCAVAGPSSSSIVITWQVDGIKYQSGNGPYVVPSAPSCSTLGNDVQVCMSTLSGMIDDGSQHNYSCIISSAQGVDMFSLPDTHILRLYPPSGEFKKMCTTYSFTVNDTRCASNHSLTCTPALSPTVSPSLRPSTAMPGSPTTAAVVPTSLPTKGHPYTSGIPTSTSIMILLPDSVYSTGLPDSSLKLLHPTVTVGLNLTGDVSTSTDDLTRMSLYVVAGIATVFALTIIILSVLCLVLCLKRSQTADTDTLKSKLVYGCYVFV